MADPSAIACAACGWVGDLHQHHLVPVKAGGRHLPTVKLCPPCHGLVHGMAFPMNHVAAIHAGLERARARGRRLGRPRLPATKEAQVRQLLAAGIGICKTARLIGIGVSPVQRIRAEIRDTEIPREIGL